jgi:endonuclease/exonuclease/phosphatase family metal-dependent hydrolase
LAVVLVTAACSSADGSRAGGEAGTPTATVRVVNQNLLHGTACPAESNRCDLPARVALFLRQLRRAGCPEIVAIEEGNATTVRELRRGLEPCGYELVSDDDPSQDREIVLTTEHVISGERIRLAGPLRTAYRVRLGTPAGLVDLVATHLASSSDDRPCDAATCPPPCEATDTVNTCQARQIVDLLAEDPPPERALTVIAGDLNAQPGEPTIRALVDAGYVDTHLAVGNDECTPQSTEQCTSGRVDDALTDLTDPRSRQTERIDYILTGTSGRCRPVRPTGVFAPRGGPTRSTDGIVFPADHSGVIATFRCRTNAKDRASVDIPPTSASSRATRSEGVTPEATRDEVSAAFAGLFAPNPDADAQLANLENAAALRDSFIARKESVGALADQTSVRIDSFDAATAEAVDVTFSILLDGAVVLDALPGRAVLVDGRWLVSTGTYCQVATLGVDTIPEACR